MRVVFANGTSANVECDVDEKTLEALKVLSGIVKESYQKNENGYDMETEDVKLKIRKWKK
jgi:hypothetical protein